MTGLYFIPYIDRRRDEQRRLNVKAAYRHMKATRKLNTMTFQIPFVFSRGV